MDIFNLTGCLSKCKKYAYITQPGGMQYEYYENSGQNAMKLQLYFSNAEHELREQVNASA